MAYMNDASIDNVEIGILSLMMMTFLGNLVFPHIHIIYLSISHHHHFAVHFHEATLNLSSKPSD